MKPSFIGIGAQKCASTWLHRIIATHPAVRVPQVKEADFFSYRFDHGYQWYERQFGPCDAQTRTGEISPSYFHDPTAPARVSRYNPDIKILLTLRDPVERAMSNHRHEVRLGHLVGDDLSFETGLANNPMYIEQGLYAKHLRNWMKYFPRQQIFVALLEDIEADPDKVARDVFRFLDIDDTHRPELLNQRFNQSIANRSQRLFRAKEQLYRLSRTPALSWLWSAAAGVGARDLYRKLNTAERDERVPPMSAATERAMRRAFAADVADLEQILERRLDHWGSNIAPGYAAAVAGRGGK